VNKNFFIFLKNQIRVGEEEFFSVLKNSKSSDKPQKQSISGEQNDFFKLNLF